MKVTNFLKNEKVRKEDSFSNSSLHGAGKLSHTEECLFSNKTGHYSDQCQTVFFLSNNFHLLQTSATNKMKMKIQYKI